MDFLLFACGSALWLALIVIAGMMCWFDRANVDNYEQVSWFE